MSLNNCQYLVDVGGKNSNMLMPCGEICEGKTKWCATHNRVIRKESTNKIKANEKRKALLSQPTAPRATVKDLKDSNLWVPFSKYIRLRDSDENGICTCFTCDRKLEWNSGMQAGHFIGRRHWATRYHEQNVHGQCPNCNMFQSGMQYEYSIKIDEKYGSGTASKLHELSRTITKFTQEDIDELAAHYRSLVKEQLSRLATVKQTV